MPTDATGTPTPLGIPKYNPNVDAPSGLGFNAAMDAIDVLIADRATTASVANKIDKPAGPAAKDALVWNGSTWEKSSAANPINETHIDPGSNGQVLTTTAGASAWGDPPGLPWLIDVGAFMTAISQVNWNNVSVDTSAVYNGVNNSSGAQNDEINFDVVLAAGTWTFELMHTQNTNRGIYSVQLDGAEKGTIDGYSAALTRNVRSTVAGIAVAASGKVRLKLKMATKNASSTQYYGSIQHIQFRRTA